MSKDTHLWISTDLDGSLLDSTYSWEPARPAIERIRSVNVPLILNSSKTFSELKFITEIMGINHPLICENGGVIAIPETLPLSESAHDSDRCAGYRFMYPGTHRDRLLDTAHALRVEYGYQFSGFSDWTKEEVMQHTGLSGVEAARAKCRFATEPILWQDSDERKIEFTAALKDHGIRISEGGRFSHIMGNVNKGATMCYLLELYAQHSPDQYRTVLALGDSDNDLEMLSSADIAGVIPDSMGKRLKPEAARIIHTDYPGPVGWNEIVEQVLNERSI